MNLTSLELGKELFELTGWTSNYCHTVRNEHGVATTHWYQYDLGYLLRKLPDWIDWPATLNVAQWTAKMGLNETTIFDRLRYGWTEQDAVMTPIGSKRTSGKRSGESQ